MPKKNRIMIKEFFPPNEEELLQMIADLKIEMDEAESQAEWNQFDYQLKELQQKLKQLKNH